VGNGGKKNDKAFAQPMTGKMGPGRNPTQRPKETTIRRRKRRPSGHITSGQHKRDKNRNIGKRTLVCGPPNDNAAISRDVGNKPPSPRGVAETQWDNLRKSKTKFKKN